MLFPTTTLYRKSATGALIQWSIEAINLEIENQITMEWGWVDGNKTHQSETIYEGLAGRTLDEQTLSRVSSRINKQLDQGYVYDKQEALTKPTTNSLNMPKPMLAKKFKDVKRPERLDWNNMYVQMKYDGHRCLVNWDGSQAIAYSRNGKSIEAITEILECLTNVGLSLDTPIDGELYLHNTPLQTISSLVRKRQPDTSKLTYVIYDIMLEDEPYTERLKYLKSIIAKPGFLYLAPSELCKEDKIPEILRNAKRLNYEGLILRTGGGFYENKRSGCLLKVKFLEDCEFLVVDITPSEKEGYAILCMVTPDGKEFSATAPGDFETKHYIMQNKDVYIGRYCKVEFANYTIEGKPFHPIATMWRHPSDE